MPPGHAAAAGNTEQLILAKIQQKHVKGGEAYASGKTLVVFLNSGEATGIRTRLQSSCRTQSFSMGYGWSAYMASSPANITYFATRIDLAGTPKWRVRIAPDFDDWTVETIPSRSN